MDSVHGKNHHNKKNRGVGYKGSEQLKVIAALAEGRNYVPSTRVKQLTSSWKSSSELHTHTLTHK